MRKILLFLCALLSFIEWCPQTMAQVAVTPGWLRYLGDGSDGDYSCTSGKCTLGGEHWYSSFTVSAGATVVTTAGNNAIIIRSTGACNVAGTISNSVNTAGGGGINSQGGDFGGGGGGGGGGALSGKIGRISVGDGFLPIDDGGIGGAVVGGNGGTGETPNRGQYRMLISGGTFWPVGGSVGGQGGGNGSGIGGGLGGNAGGPVILVCSSINFTGRIDVSGGAGAPAPANNTGAGGGGGAGYVIFSAVNYTANSGSINLAGGPGGSCGSFAGCGSGGTGGGGWNLAITLQ
jgi:hypothetical protein